MGYSQIENNLTISGDLSSSFMNTRSNEASLLLGISSEDGTAFEVGYIYKKINNIILHGSDYHGLRLHVQAELVYKAGVYLDYDYIKGDVYIFTENDVKFKPTVKKEYLSESTIGLFYKPIKSLGVYAGYMIYSYDPWGYETMGKSPHKKNQNVVVKLKYTFDVAYLFSSNYYRKRMWME